MRRKIKVRLVYDASAKYCGISLNDTLLQGTDCNNALRSVLTRFREEKFGIVADIASMFNAFRVSPQDSNFLRFFWFQDNDSNKHIVQYRAKTHIFGARSSPAVANYCLRYTTTEPHADQYPLSKAFINESFYVDDSLSSSFSVKEAIEIVQGARAILSHHNFRLHKIMSNSKQMMEAFPEAECAGNVHSFNYDGVSMHSTLGINWHTEKDSFVIKVNLPNKPFTKRGILSVVNSVFDPLGFAAPVSLAGRLLQRKVLPPKTKSTLELESCGWDDHLPECFLNDWENWKDSLKSLDEIMIPRCFTSEQSNKAKRELHVFVDASELAIGLLCI